MKRALCVIFLTGCSLLWPAGRLHAEESRAREEKPVKEVEITKEDRQVVRMIELLEMMEMLKDMELLEGEPKAVSEDKK